MPHNTHFEFFKMLCKAAGLEQHKVSEITCYAGAKERVEFSAKLVGKDEVLAKVLGAPDESSPPSLDMGIQKVNIGME